MKNVKLYIKHEPFSETNPQRGKETLKCINFIFITLSSSQFFERLTNVDGRRHLIEEKTATELNKLLFSLF